MIWFLPHLSLRVLYVCFNRLTGIKTRLGVMILPEPLIYYRGVKLIFTGGYANLTVAFKGPNVILELYKCNYALTRGKVLGAASG